MFFTPALTALIGHKAWWPGHADEVKHDRQPATSRSSKVVPEVK
jgi:RND superfamily putative drug exporter